MSKCLSCSLALLCAVGCGCGRAEEKDHAERFNKRAAIAVDPALYNDYAGAYRLPSGALLKVVRDGDRLMAGIPPYELYPQTTRRFAWNRNPAEIIFERDGDGRVPRLNYRLARRDMWATRVESAANDPVQFVDAGGHRLRMLITGIGSPTIVIEDGFGSSIEMRAGLQAELSQWTRVITYEHAGAAGSETGPQPRDARQIAGELRTALRNADIDPPFLLLGGSIGGDYIRVFAHQYAADVSGLVLLDPTPDWDALFKWAEGNAPQRQALYRNIVATADRSVHQLMKHQEPSRQQEWQAIESTRVQARGAFPLPDVPVVQITGAKSRSTQAMAEDKVKFFEAWLREHIPHAKHVLAEKSGHAIYCAEPELVVREIRAVLESTRQNEHPH